MATPKRAPQCHQLYMLVNDCAEVTTKTYIGHAVDVERALQQHNNKLPGAPRVTRKAAGHWKLALRIVLPVKRNLAHDALVDYWKRNSRKANRRLEFGIKIAKQLEVPWFLNSDLFADKEITSTIPEIVEAYRRQRARRNRKAIRASLVRRFKRCMDADPKQTNSRLVMRTGRKRERREMIIDFSRSTTGLTNVDRLKLLRRRPATTSRLRSQPESVAATLPAAMTPVVEAASKTRCPKQAAIVGRAEGEALLARLWLKQTPNRS